MVVDKVMYYRLNSIISFFAIYEKQFDIILFIDTIINKRKYSFILIDTYKVLYVSGQFSLFKHYAKVMAIVILVY